jgi:hypothetical protein
LDVWTCFKSRIFYYGRGYQFISWFHAICDDRFILA